MAYQECVALSAVFDDAGASQLSVEIGVFKQLLEQVDHSSQLELIASKDAFIVRSFYQAFGAGVGASGQRHMSTEMSIPTGEFLYYRYSSDEPTEELVMSIKELKSMISFCEAIEIPVFSIFFNGGGRPCKLSCEHSSFIVSLVVATLDPPNAGRPSSAVSQEIFGEAASDGGQLDQRYKQNDGNVDGTVRRLVPSAEVVDTSQADYDGGFAADDGDGFGGRSSRAGGGNIGADDGEVYRDGKNVFTDFSMDDSASQASYSRKRGREDSTQDREGMSVSGASDVVLGPGRPAFSNAALKRLIDSDSDEDEDFDTLRNL
jgi:hypothetical protein